MTTKQIAIILHKLHGAKTNEIDKIINNELNYFNLDQQQKEKFQTVIEQKYSEGIKQLNHKQLENILEKVGGSRFDEEVIKARLKFYEIDKIYFAEIIDFFKNNNESNISIDVSEIDSNFKGVQVASRDDFNQIINQGYTGDWVITPSSVKYGRVQVASMNESGNFPRGYYLNAEIESISPIKYGDQTRYRIFIHNPVIVDSGNRNVKFNLNPVKYIN